MKKFVFFSLRISSVFLMEFPVWSNIYQCHVKNLAPFILPLKLKKMYIYISNDNYNNNENDNQWPLFFTKRRVCMCVHANNREWWQQMVAAQSKEKIGSDTN
jgi:hypothetical protein